MPNTTNPICRFVAALREHTILKQSGFLTEEEVQALPPGAIVLTMDLLTVTTLRDWGLLSEEEGKEPPKRRTIREAQAEWKRQREELRARDPEEAAKLDAEDEEDTTADWKFQRRQEEWEV